MSTEPIRFDCASLVGLTVDDAQRRVEAAGLPFRLAEPPRYYVTLDLRAGRVTARRDENYVVIGARQEFYSGVDK